MSLPLFKVTYKGIYQQRGDERVLVIPKFITTDVGTNEGITVLAGDEVRGGISAEMFDHLQKHYPGAFVKTGEVDSPQEEPEAQVTSSRIAVCFSNGIGNFVHLTPFLQNLKNPTVLIPENDHRLEAIRSISPWPVRAVKDGAGISNQYDKVFVIWCWPRHFEVQGPNVVHQLHPDWASGLFEGDYYLNLLDNPVRHPSKIRTRRKFEMKRAKGEHLIAMVNGSASEIWKNKEWSTQHLVDLAEMITEKHNAQIVYLGSLGEWPTGDAIGKKLNARCWNLAGQLDLDETADIIAQCDYIVCNDTGLMHVADAVGTKGVVPWGPTMWSKSRPENDNMFRVQANGSCSKAPCYPSQLVRTCTNPVCMTQITPEMIYEVLTNELF